MTKPKNDWVFIDVEPIISKELWSRCNAILDEQEKKFARPSRLNIQLFIGYAYCSRCGTKMYVPSNSPKYTCSKCRRKIGMEDFETIFQEQLKAFFFSDQEITHYLQTADHVIKEKEELLKTLTKEEEKLKEEMDKLYRLYLNGEIPGKGFGDKYRPLDERVQQIQSEMPTLQGEIDFLKIQYLSSNEIITEAKNLSVRWPTLEENEKRRIVETITERIGVGADEVEINLCYMPSPLEMAAGKERNLGDSKPENMPTSKDRRTMSKARY